MSLASKRRLAVAAAVVAWTLVAVLPTMGDDNGTVANSVTVAASQEPCLTLSETSIDWGTLPLSSLTQPSVDGRFITLDDCSGLEQTLLVAGTNAVSTTRNPGVVWQLGNLAPCLVGLNSYAVTSRRSDPGLGDPDTLVLEDGNYQSHGEIDANSTRLMTVTLSMPCEGSHGVGKTMNFEVNYLVTLP